jgi:hypothetical protein
MKAGITILLSFALFIFACSDADMFYPSTPPGGGSGAPTQYYDFEWMEGVHDATGFPFKSRTQDTIADSNYHIGFYFNVIQRDSTPINKILNYKLTIVRFKRIGDQTVEYNQVFMEEVKADTDSIKVIYDGYYEDVSNDSIHNYKIEYQVSITCKEPISYYGFWMGYWLHRNMVFIME